MRYRQVNPRLTPRHLDEELTRVPHALRADEDVRRNGCDAGQPCRACVSHGTECTKDESDGRRQQTKQAQAFREKAVLLDLLLAVIQVASPQDLSAVVNVVRGQVSNRDLRSFLLEISSNYSFIQKEFGRPDVRRPVRGRIEDVINPILMVPAKPWTTVTDDDDYVSHLLSLWFTWAHQWWSWVEKECFLTAMRARDVSSPLCKPYLVNMILADACLLDTLEDDEPEPNQWIRNQFYNEAVRGLDMEQGAVSLCTVAALGVQWTYLNTNQAENIGTPTLFRQIYLSKDLEKWRSRLLKEVELTDRTLTHIDLSLSRLSWTVYAMNSFTLINLGQSLPLERPRFPKPQTYHFEQTEENHWSPYPRAAQKVEFHASCQYYHFITLAEIVATNHSLFLSHGTSDLDTLIPKFNELDQQIKHWHMSLPDCLSKGRYPTPHVLALHALYQWVIVIAAKQFAATVAGRPQRPVIRTTPKSAQQETQREESIAAALEISRLLYTHRSTWGSDYFPVITTLVLAVAPIALFEQFRDRPESQNGLKELCITISSVSKRFSVGRSILAALQQVAQRENIELPPPCSILISKATEREPDHRLESRGLDWLLHKWTDLDLE